MLRNTTIPKKIFKIDSAKVQNKYTIIATTCHDNSSLKSGYIFLFLTPFMTSPPDSPPSFPILPPHNIDLD